MASSADERIGEITSRPRSLLGERRRHDIFVGMAGHNLLSLAKSGIISSFVLKGKLEGTAIGLCLPIMSLLTELKNYW